METTCAVMYSVCGSGDVLVSVALDVVTGVWDFFVVAEWTPAV